MDNFNSNDKAPELAICSPLLRGVEAAWIDAVLRNDESSTDEELYQHFVANGVSATVAITALARRDALIGRIA